VDARRAVAVGTRVASSRRRSWRSEAASISTSAGSGNVGTALVSALSWSTQPKTGDGERPQTGPNRRRDRLSILYDEKIRSMISAPVVITGRSSRR
jgi:hypothetical protein